jgi:hypothetical protein
MLRLVALAGLLPLVYGSAALADDLIHAGNWEFTTSIKTGGLPNPSGEHQPPGVTFDHATVSHVHNACVSDDHPFPTEGTASCTIDKNERQGNTINWVASCTTPHGQVHADGSSTYSGDTMEGTGHFHTTSKDGHSIDTTRQTIGKYLGPCAG